jgi:hypothetical protein
MAPRGAATRSPSGAGAALTPIRAPVWYGRSTAHPIRTEGPSCEASGETTLILDASDEHIRHDYCFRDVRRLAGYAAHRSYWQRVMTAQDRFDLTVSAIAEMVLTTENRPGEKDLVTVGVQAINHSVQAQMRHQGTSYHKAVDVEPNMPNFWVYWWPQVTYTAGHENGIVETIAMFQILPQLKPLHRDVILALAIHGTYDKAAASLGKTHRTFIAYLSAARKELLRLWHEAEQPSRIWGRDVFGIEGYERDEAITVRTLRQRKRKRKKRAESNGNPGNT